MQALKRLVGAGNLAEATSRPTFDASRPRPAEDGRDPPRLFERLAGMFGATGNGPWPRSIQARLVWIVLILAAPALVGLFAIALGLYQYERDQVSQSAIRTVRALVAVLDRDFAGTMSAARVLAESPSLASHDLAEFHREAKSVLSLLGGSAVVLAEAGGQQVINTRVPYGMPLPVRRERVNHDRVFETARPSVSDIVIGAVAKKPVFDIDVPVFRDGRVVYSLGIAIEPARLDDLLQNQRLPAGWVATITDSSGTIVARTSDPELVGQRVPVRLSAMTPSAPGLVETHRADGTPIIVGFSKSEVSNWTVAIGVPTAQLRNNSNSVLLYGAASVFCALIVGLITATYQARRIARAVQRLIPSALAVGHGELPNAPRSGVRETDDVARALVLAHELLRVRTRQRDSAEMTVAARSLADEMFRLAVEACPNGMMMYDASGRILMVNGEIEKQFGYARSELIGQPVAMLVPERYRLQHRRHLQHFTLKPETLGMDAALSRLGRRKDGTEFPTEIGLNPINAGEDLMVLCVCVDVTERKRAERLKDEFVATVSHELRTPLTSIAGALGLLIGQWTKDLPESAARLLTIAHANSLRLGRLINDILDIEKIESGHVVFNLRRVEVRPLVAQVIEDIKGYADTYGVRVELDAESADADSNADPDRLSQAVANLLSNAIKFSPNGEEVRVSVENNGYDLRIIVRDHGPGIPDHFKLHLFEKFAQADATDSRQKGGTGLGLSIVKEIVGRLGGRVGFQDAPDGGAIFYIDLPVWDDTVGGTIELVTRGTPPRILLCERDAVVRKAVRTRLSSAGLTVDFAHTVEAAIARCSTSRYAAVVIGVPLGNGDGCDAVAKIRELPHHGSTLILVASEASEGTSAAKPRDSHILKWVKQPLDVESLVSGLVAALPARLRPRPRILHVDDDRDVLAIVAHELNAIADVVSADSVEMARQMLATGRIDLVIVDTELGMESGMDLLPDIRDSSGRIIPVVVFSNASPQLPGDSERHPSWSKAMSPLDFLKSAVLDRLGLSPALPEKEVA